MTVINSNQDFAVAYRGYTSSLKDILVREEKVVAAEKKVKELEEKVVVIRPPSHLIRKRRRRENTLTHLLMPRRTWLL